MSQYPNGVVSPDTLALQKALLAHGFTLGPDGADGIMGGSTKRAIRDARTAFGLSDEIKIDLALLVELGIHTPRKETPMNSNWFSSLVTTTAFKYLVAMVATYAASKLGVDKGAAEGVLTQLVGVVAMVWGMWEGSRSKVVLNGQRVSFSKLPSADQAKVEEVVEKNT